MEAWAPIQARIAALDGALWQRATDLANEAGGLGRGRNVWHNAMIARDSGAPWRDVDYRTLRRAIRVDEVQRARLREIERALFASLYRRHYPERV